MAKLKKILPLTITIIIFFIIFHSFNYKEIFNIIKSADTKILFIALFLLFSTTLISAKRWQIILRAHKININYSEILKIYLGNIPFSKISPSNSGDLVRALYFKNELTLSNKVGIIILENLFDILTLGILALFGAFIFNNAIIIFINLIFIFTVLGFIFYGPKIKIKNKKWKTIIDNFFLAKKTVISNPKLFFILIVYSFIPWLIIIVCVKLFFLAFGVDLPIFTILSLHPFVVFLGLLPITFSGIGVRETAMLYFYSTLTKKSIILAASLAYSISAAIILPLLCLPFLFITIKYKVK